jgi:lysophospholipase L1-like esterase
VRGLLTLLTVSVGVGVGVGALLGCRDEVGGIPPASAPTAPLASTDAGRTSLRYLALGDSFTIGTGSSADRAFPARLVDRWGADSCAVALRNVAVNGYTTDDVIGEELPEIATYKPTFVTVAVGANDIVRGSAIEVYRANVRKILAAARASGARVVVLPQPDWSRSPTAASFGSPSELDAKIRAFNAALADEARAAGATYVDLAPLMQRQAADRMLAKDGLHPSADAYDAWAAELARAIPSPCRS